MNNCYIMRNRNGVSKMSTEQYEKVPNGYYVVAKIFIFAALIEFLYTDLNGELMVNIGFYSTYVSFVGLALCRAYIYNLSIYWLVKNKLWGLISTTLIAFYIVITNIRCIIGYGSFIYGIRVFIFSLVFAYLSSIVISKFKKYLEI